MIANVRRLDFGPCNATDLFQGHPYGMLDPQDAGLGRLRTGVAFFTRRAGGTVPG